MTKLALLAASMAITLLAGGCSSQGSPADAPADFRVVAGDASVTVTWTAEPDVDYWIFYGPGDSITTENWALQGGSVLPKSTPPRTITGLTNGRTYSFTINGRKDGGPGGSGAPTQVATPMLAGANWAVGAPLGTARLNGVTAGLTSTSYATVAVGAGGAIYSGTTGGTLVARTNPAAPADLNATWYATPGFVAAGAGGLLLFSTDSIAWTTRTSGTTAHFFGGTSAITGGYVAVGAGGALVTSPDGAEWTVRTSGTTSDLFGARYGGGRYLAVGAAGAMVTSTDGANWTVIAPVTGNDLRAVAYALVPGADNTASNLYVAVGAAGTVLTSPDGLAWTVQAPFTTATLADVTYGGQFVAVGPAGAIFTSPDGVTWTARASGTTRDLTSVVRTLSGYTIVGDQGTNLTSY